MDDFLKLLLLHTRLHKKYEEVSSASQFGLNSGFATDHIQSSDINSKLPRSKKIQKVDYKKAFDNVKLNLLVSYLIDLGRKDVKPLKSRNSNTKRRNY